MTTEKLTEELVALAVVAAKKAGSLLSLRAEDLLKVNAEQGRDIKLEADRAAERVIRSLLKGGSGLAILGEEMGYDGEDIEGELQWIVDPLDGTANYIRGIPACCVSIALWHGYQPLLGVVYDFNMDELLIGKVESNEVTLNGAPVCVSDIDSKAKAILATGFPVAMDVSGQALESFFTEVQSYKKIRMVGSAALAMAYVACGRFDVYKEDAGRLWDVAAGIALIQAAGGFVDFKVTDKDLFMCDVEAAGTFKLLLNC